MEEYGIAAFRSRQQVMRLEEALKRAGLTVRVISTPHDVAVGCGLSVRFDMKDVRAVQTAISQLRPTNLIGLYRVEQRAGRNRLTTITKQG